jgi:hypothetical protein
MQLEKCTRTLQRATQDFSRAVKGNARVEARHPVGSSAPQSIRSSSAGANTHTGSSNTPFSGDASSFSGIPVHFGDAEDRAQSARDEEDEREIRRIAIVEDSATLQRDLAAERDAGVREVEAAVLEVNEIFTDLATLVNEQQPLIDTIEGNITETGGNVETGLAEIRKAETYQKKSRTKMCWLLLCVLILAGASVVIVILLKK